MKTRLSKESVSAFSSSRLLVEICIDETVNESQVTVSARSNIGIEHDVAGSINFSKKPEVAPSGFFKNVVMGAEKAMVRMSTSSQASANP